MAESLRAALVAAAILGAAGGAITRQYPGRPVTLLCCSTAGSPVGHMARLLAAELGQNVVVDNRTGGSGIVMVNTMLK
jgi:tripartite-type tricarboxylate transporter receptor subunit TctC